jgi:hypothetical protein
MAFHCRQEILGAGRSYKFKLVIQGVEFEEITMRSKWRAGAAVVCPAPTIQAPSSNASLSIPGSSFFQRSDFRRYVVNGQVAPGASGSSMTRANDWVPMGGLTQLKPALVSSPLQVYFSGISWPSPKASLVRVKAVVGEVTPEAVDSTGATTGASVEAGELHEAIKIAIRNIKNNLRMVPHITKT